MSLEEIKERIDYIGNLPDNWDGYNSSSVDKIVCENTSYFVGPLNNEIINLLSKYDITPTSYGTIAIDFVNENNMVSVEVGNKKIGFFTSFKNVKDLTFYVGELIDNGIPKELVKAFNILMNKEIIDNGK